MQRRRWIQQCAGLPLLLVALPAARAAGPTQADAATAIRQTLERGASAAVSLLGRPDGFLGNPKVRIPLPDYLDEAANVLRRFGQGKRVDDLVVSMNRAAEQA